MQTFNYFYQIFPRSISKELFELRKKKLQFEELILKEA